MSIIGISNGQISGGGNGAGTTASIDQRVRQSADYTSLAAQDIGTAGQGNRQTPRTGAQPLNATGRGRFVNIIV
jgi:hypothetical protein